MESPLKERLTGALIVVAVLVIVVPEMLSGPGKTPVTANPAGESGPPVRTYSLELGSNPAERQGQSALTPQSSEPARVAPPVDTPPVATPPPAPAPAPEAVATVTAPVAAPAPAEAAPATKPAVQPVATGGKGQWWTQLGSFSARDNAERLARDLRGKGYSIDVARIKVGGKDLYRVRAGPAASREAAVALQARLAGAGHKSSLVPP